MAFSKTEVIGPQFYWQPELSSLNPQRCSMFSSYSKKMRIKVGWNEKSTRAGLSESWVQFILMTFRTVWTLRGRSLFYGPVVPSLSVKLSHKQASKGCLRSLPQRVSFVVKAAICIMLALAFLVLKCFLNVYYFSHLVKLLLGYWLWL